MARKLTEKVVTVVEPRHKRRLERLADSEHRSLGDIVRRALIRELDDPRPIGTKGR